MTFFEGYLLGAVLAAIATGYARLVLMDDDEKTDRDEAGVFANMTLGVSAASWAGFVFITGIFLFHFWRQVKTDRKKMKEEIERLQRDLDSINRKEH